ncbi:hypothetical protein ACCT19_33175 [Rhizobium ruizarguesonis]
MTGSVDLDRMAQEVRAASEACGTMILESILASEHLPAVAVDGDTFPSFVRHLKPRLIYMVLTAFDAKEEVAAHFEEDELDTGLKRLATKWTNRNGQSSRLILGLMADGVGMRWFGVRSDLKKSSTRLSARSTRRHACSCNRALPLASVPAGCRSGGDREGCWRVFCDGFQQHHRTVDLSRRRDAE